MSENIFMEFLHMSSFDKNLAILRKSRKLTQMQLADLLEIQPRLISRWEQGETKPQFDYIVKLSNVLEVSIDQLVVGQEYNETNNFKVNNKRLKELCEQIDQLSDEDQNVVCYIMDSLIKKEKVKKIVY